MWCITLSHLLDVGHSGLWPCSGPDLLFSHSREETQGSTGAFKASTNALLPGEHLMIHTPLPMCTTEDSAGTASVWSAAISNKLCAWILIFLSFRSLSSSLFFVYLYFFSHRLICLPKRPTAFSQKSQVKRQWETEKCTAHNCYKKHN